MPRETQQPETYTVTTECFTAAPVTASINLRLTGDSGQGNRRNMRRMVAEILGNRSACSLENTMVLCLKHKSLQQKSDRESGRVSYILHCEVHARHTCKERAR